MPASGREFLIPSGSDYKGAQAVNMRLQQITGTSDFNNLVDGLFAFNSSTKRLQFVDTAVGGNLVNVPRIDSGQSETVQAAWTFSRGANTPPFIAAATLPSVGSTATMVTNLNAHYVSGCAADVAANASTLVCRDGSGRAKVGYPSASDDAANKQFVNDTLAGLTTVFAACRVVAVANVNISSAPATIDSVTLANGDRVLLTGQTTGSANGLYVFNGAGAAMTRATDADSSAEMLTGATTFITGGTIYAGSSWRLITPPVITLGTTALTFTQISSSVQMDAGPGLGKNGNEMYVKLGSAGSPAGRSYTQGGLLWCDSASTLNQTGALTGILIGNGTSAPGAVTGTANALAKFGSAGVTLANSQITDNGTTVTLGGTVNVAALSASRFVKTDASSNLTTASSVSLTSEVSGTLPLANGGTGTTAAFTAGSVVFAGASGVYAQNNANLFWDNSNNRLGIGTAAPNHALHVVSNSDLKLHLDGTGNDFIKLTRPSAGTWFIGNLNSGFAVNETSTAGGSARFFIASDGKVGIGSIAPSSLLDVVKNSIGATQADASGLTLSNTAAAAVSAQQYSPAIKWSGRGWKTNATAASQSVDFRAYVAPVQGAAAPSGYLTFEAAINGGSYSEIFRADSSGALLIQGTKKVPVSYTQNLGTSATSYVVTHNLGTSSVICFVRNASTGQCGVAGYATTTTNSITVYFDTAPTAGLYDVIIIAIA